MLHQHVNVPLALALIALGIFAGWLGAVVGIGGGVVIVPALVLGFGFQTKVAVATSLVAVVATSVAAASAYAGAGQLNMRLALTLEIATTVGGLVGGLVAVLIAPSVLDGLFAAVMLVTAVLMFRGRNSEGEALEGSGDPEVAGAAETAGSGATGAGPVRATASPAAEVAGAAAASATTVATLAEDAIEPEGMEGRVGWEDRGHLGGAYRDAARGVLVVYRAIRVWIGWSVSFVAGMLSGMLGVGGGFLKVPAINLGMKVPIKVAAATSNFMIGVTAIASLFVYFARGYVLPYAAAPVALGIAVGAYVGARSSQAVSSRTLGLILAVVLLFVAVQMGLKASGVANV